MRERDYNAKVKSALYCFENSRSTNVYHGGEKNLFLSVLKYFKFTRTQHAQMTATIAAETNGMSLPNMPGMMTGEYRKRVSVREIYSNHERAGRENEIMI